MAKLINKGKGETKLGINSRIVATISHSTIKGLCKSFTFWAVAEFEEIEVDDKEVALILQNLVEKKNDRGTFYVWNGQ
jgi:hypothetical protein